MSNNNTVKYLSSVRHLLRKNYNEYWKKSCSRQYNEKNLNLFEDLLPKPKKTLLISLTHNIRILFSRINSIHYIHFIINPNLAVLSDVAAI